MKKITKWLIAWLNRDKKVSDVPMCDFERIRYELKPCDILLVEGRSRVSEIIKLVTTSPWSHAAIYIGRLHDIEDPNVRNIVKQHCQCEYDTQLVIESILGKGTIVSPLTNYIRDHLRICRPKGLAYRDAQEVVRYAVSRLGANYDVRQIFDLFRFLFPWFILPRRWRSSLFKRHAGRPTRTVCSTMIAEAFYFVQFPILPLVKKTAESEVQLFMRNPKLVTPSDFDYSPYFEIIKYPFIDFSFHTDYRLLPWKGSGVLTGEEAELYLSHSDHLPQVPSTPKTEDKPEAASESDDTPPGIEADDSQDKTLGEAGPEDCALTAADTRRLEDQSEEVTNGDTKS